MTLVICFQDQWLNRIIYAAVPPRQRTNRKEGLSDLEMWRLVFFSTLNSISKLVLFLGLHSLTSVVSFRSQQFKHPISTTLSTQTTLQVRRSVWSGSMRASFYSALRSVSHRYYFYICTRIYVYIYIYIYIYINKLYYFLKNVEITSKKSSGLCKRYTVWFIKS